MQTKPKNDYKLWGLNATREQNTFDKSCSLSQNLPHNFQTALLPAC